MIILRKLICLFVFLILLPSISVAAVPVWKIDPNVSHLTFTATQNGAPVTGEFKKFIADIHFDLDHLDANTVKVTVDVSSISDPYNQLADTLKEADWFDVKKFPQAIFTSNQFSKTGDKTYQSKGNLTIRDKTLPVTLVFTQEEYKNNKARFKGSTTIKRIDYGIGQGQWADTNAIKDEVRIDFDVTAIKP